MLMTATRKIIDFTTNVLGYAGLGQLVRVDRRQPVKINLGCGLSIAPGWINVDGSLNDRLRIRAFLVSGTNNTKRF